MTQQSLALRYHDHNHQLYIVDVHHNQPLTSFHCPDEETYQALVLLVREGGVSFEYLLSDAVIELSDIAELDVHNETDSLLGFAVGDEVLFMDKVYTIHIFNTTDFPMTADIVNIATAATVTATLDALTKHIEHEFTQGQTVRVKDRDTLYEFRAVDAEGVALLYDGHLGMVEVPLKDVIACPSFSHHELTTAGPADNEANKPQFTEGQTVFVKNYGLKVYTIEAFDNTSGDDMIVLANSIGEQFTVLRAELLDSLHDDDKNEPKSKAPYEKGQQLYIKGLPEPYIFQWMNEQGLAYIQRVYDAKSFLKHPSELYIPSVSDGSTASYYELPEDATELQHLIAFKDMNAQMGEIFRAAYRYGEVEHSAKIRDAKKIKFYIEAEIERLERYDT